MEPVQRLNRTAKTIESLRSLLSDNKVSQSVKQRISGLITLVTTRPNITAINHYFNHFLLQLDPENQPPVLKELLEVYHERWKHIERKTAEVAFDTITFVDQPTLLVHGCDKSILALFDLLMVKQINVNVYQTLSRPGKEGQEQALQILENGYSVNMIDDYAIANVLPECDAVLMGCEVILHNEFVAHAGSHTLAAASKFYKRPVYVMGDSRRIMNAKFFPQNVLNTIVGEGKSDARNIWKDAPNKVNVISSDKEYVPNYCVDGFILEDKLHTSEALRDEIDKVMVTKFF